MKRKSFKSVRLNHSACPEACLALKEVTDLIWVHSPSQRAGQT